MRTLLCLFLGLPLTIFSAPVRAEEPAELLGLIDKAIRAAGGEARVAKLQAVTWKTRVPGAGDSWVYSDESSAQGLDQYRAEIEVQEGSRSTRAMLVVNRDKG
jgi:hypothetical protein